MNISTKKDWLHFITGAVFAAILSTAVADVESLSTPGSDMLFKTKSCCCYCCKQNVDDEIIYTLEVQDEIPMIPVGEPPANPVIISR